MPLPALVLVGSIGYTLYRERNKARLNEKIGKEFDEWCNWHQKIKSGRSDKTRNPFGASGSPRNRASSTATRASSSSLEIQNESGETILSVAELAGLPPRQWENVHESGISLFSRLNPLLSAIPTAAIAGDVATTKYMVVEIAGGLTKAAGGNGWRAFSRGSNGIKEHAILFSPDRLQSIVGMGALWQIASIVVAQKHLHDISEKLQIISRKIEEIRAFQKNDRTSKILGCRKFFEQVFTDITVGNIPISLQTVIEDRCVELMQIEEHFRLDIKDKINATKTGKPGEEFNELVKNLVYDMQELFVCIETRLLGYQLMAIGNEDTDSMDNRLDEIRHDIERLQDNAITFARNICDKLKDEVSFWSSIGRVEESLAVLEKLPMREEFGKSFERVREEVGIVQNIIEQRKVPQEILLKVNGGKIDGFAVAEGTNP